MDGKKSYISAIALAAVGLVVGMGWLDADTAMAIAIAVTGALGASLRHAIKKVENPNS